MSDFLGRTLIQGLYICEDSQTTASRSATTGGCPPMLKLFMIGNQNQNQMLPRCPAAAPPKSRCWWECISPELAAEGGHRPGQLLSGVRRTDTFPANPDWGLAQERPENWSTALSGTGTTGPIPRRDSISKISPPRSAPIVHLCQQLLSVDTEIAMSAHDRRPPPARPLHHP